MGESSDEQTIVLRFVGAELGYFVPGVPKRDLTADDLDRLPTNWTAEKLIESGAFEAGAAPIPAAKKRATTKATSGNG